MNVLTLEQLQTQTTVSIQSYSGVQGAGRLVYVGQSPTVGEHLFAEVKPYASNFMEPAGTMYVVQTHTSLVRSAIDQVIPADRISMFLQDFSDLQKLQETYAYKD